MADVPHELSAQVGDRGEDASCDDVTLDLGEPQLDLAELGRVSRHEVQVDVGVPIQELGDLLGLVRTQVVGDHVDLLGRRLVDEDVCQEGDELRRSVPSRSSAQHLAGFGVECCVRRQRAMSVILKAVPLCPAGRRRQDQVLAVGAWIAVFSSTQNTAACAGEFTYSPMTSTALRSKSGSFEAM